MATVADIGNWTYSGDPLGSDRAEIRFLIGDTDPADQLLADREIDAAIQLSQATGSPAGTLSTATLAVQGTTTAGDNEITLDAVSVEGVVGPGASFTIAGNTQRYWVQDELEAGSNMLSQLAFWPALVATAADNAVVTFRLFDVYAAAAYCCDHLARRFARKVDVSIDGRSEAYSQISRQYAQLAATLRRQGAGAGGGMVGATLVRA